MAAKIFRINYKSDFILTLDSDAGWMTPFCIKFWTGAPSQAYFVGWNGETYTHCAYDPSEPTKLLVQFDDHHLPIGDLKFQIAYHFTAADFPNDTEDEVINPANITTEIDGQEYHVMLDFTGETAPEIEFSLPAYANEAQRIANEELRIAAEQTRIQNEETRISQEQTRQENEAQRIRNEQTRISQEEARVREFATLKHESETATTAANNAATLANQKAQLAVDKAQLATDKAALAQDAANLANQKAQLAADKAALAQDAADLANQKAQLAQQKAEYAQTQGDYAKQQGDYAKEQGDYAKRNGDDAATQMQQQAQAFNEAQAARQTAYQQAEGTESGSVAGDGSRWGAFKTNEAARDAKVDAKVADITNLQEAVAEGAVYDVSAKNPTAGPNNDGKWGSLSALLSDANLNTLIPSAVRRGGMSIKFVLSSDNKYVQYRLIAGEWSIDPEDWAIAEEGVYVENPEFIYVKTDAEGKILWAIKTDGDIFYGAGVPQQVIDYINEKINEELAEYDDIVAFLGNLIEGDYTLQQLLDNKVSTDTLSTALLTKVDKEEGKSLIATQYIQEIDNPEYIQVITDNDDRIIGGIRGDGTIVFMAPIESKTIIQVSEQLQEEIDEVNTDLSAQIVDLGRRVDEAGIVGITADQINNVSALGAPVTIFGTDDTASSPNGAATGHDDFAFFETCLVQVSPTMLYMYYVACGTDDLIGVDITDAAAVTAKATTYMAYCDLSEGATTWHRGFPQGITAPYPGTNKIKVLAPDGTEVQRIVNSSIVKVQGDETFPFRMISGASIEISHGGFHTGAGTFMWKSADGVTFTHCVPVWRGNPDGQISAIVRGDVIKLYERYRDPDNQERQIGMMYIDTDGVLLSPYHHFFGNNVYGAFASKLDARREILFPTSLTGGFHTVCYIVDGAEYKSVTLPDNFTESGTMRYPYVCSNGLIYDNKTEKFYIFWNTNDNGHGAFGYDKPMYIKCREISFSI